MRTLRATLSVAMALALVSVWGGFAAAQAGADPMAPAFFTYTTEPVGESTMPEGMVVGDDQDMQMVEATDPRASGLVIISANSNLIELSDGAIMTATTSERLTNDGGAWSGTGRFVMAGSGDGGVMASMGVLTGEGDYEGLTLIMGQSEGAGPISNWGVIVPSDQVPSMLGLEVDEEVAAIPTKDVVVATQTIQKGTTIGPEVVSLRAVPIDEPNKYALTDPKEVVGRVAAIDILESQMLAPNLLEPSAE